MFNSCTGLQKLALENTYWQDNIHKLETTGVDPKQVDKNAHSLNLIFLWIA